jgi:hypothetical protein
LTGLNPAATLEGPAAQACKSQPGMDREGECKNHCFEQDPIKLVADRKFLKDTLVTLRTIDLEISQQSPALCHEAQQAPARRVILLMSFEMLSELNDTVCQQRDLHFRRPGIGLVVLIPGYNLPLCFCHQCHLKVAALFLHSLLFSRFVSTPVYHT